MRVLYLRRLPGTTGRDSLSGRSLYDALADSADATMLAHYVSQPGEKSVSSDENDIVTEQAVRQLRPTVIYSEGGLSPYPGRWKIPESLVRELVADGAVFVVADAEVNELTRNKSLYEAAADLFSARVDYGPSNGTTPVYGIDERSCWQHPRNLLCRVDAMRISDWLRPTFADIDQVLVGAPCRLRSFESILASGNVDTSGTLQNDVWVDPIHAFPWASVGTFGSGYAVLLAGAVSSDVLTDACPNNITWLRNLATFLSEEVRRDQLRRAPDGTTPMIDTAASAKSDQRRQEPERQPSTPQGHREESPLSARSAPLNEPSHAAGEGGATILAATAAVLTLAGTAPNGAWLAAAGCMGAATYLRRSHRWQDRRFLLSLLAAVVLAAIYLVGQFGGTHSKHATQPKASAHSPRTTQPAPSTTNVPPPSRNATRIVTRRWEGRAVQDEGGSPPSEWVELTIRHAASGVNAGELQTTYIREGAKRPRASDERCTGRVRLTATRGRILTYRWVIDPRRSWSSCDDTDVTVELVTPLELRYSEQVRFSYNPYQATLQRATGSGA